MNTTQRWTLAIIAVVAIGIALLVGGVALGRTGGVMPFGSGYNMMTGSVPNQTGAGQMPYGMMGYGQWYSGTVPYGMMNGNMMGMMGGNMMGNGMMNGGMVGGFGSSKLYSLKPLSIDQAKAAVEKYLAGLNNPDLTVGEVMVFDNHAYAIVKEKSTGMGAQEVLVDPVTLAVSPEYGPNMMWNQKYGMMSSGGMMGMMGQTTPPATTGSLPVSADEAVQTAQRYLDTYLPGAQAAATPDPFYGYYTIDILRDDQPVGMLSVNGYTGQVFLHTWHGDFVEMSEE